MTQVFDSTASYVRYGCIDLVHNARTLAYHRWACANNLYDEDPHIIAPDGCYCPDDGVPADFVDPATDEVCWFDPLVPESAEFLGVIVADADGLEDSTFRRDLVDAVGNRSALQQGYSPGRQPVFDIILLATSCAGMAYGLNWVQRVLERQACKVGRSCKSCNGECLQVRMHCDDGSSDSGLRTWYSTGVLNGFQADDQQIERKCCSIKTGQIVFGTERSRSFDEDVERCTITANEEAHTACIEWRTHCLECETDPCIQCRSCGNGLDVCAGCAEKCGPCSRCFGDPLCDVGLRLIRPKAVVNECFCEPLQRVIQCCEIVDVPNGYDSVLSFELYSGYDLSVPDYGLRNVRIKVYQNPQSLPPINDDASYDLWKQRKPCASIELSYVPPDSTLVVDGRLEQVFLICDGVCRPFNQSAASALGGSLFPLLLNCHNALVCVEWDLANTTFQVSGGVYGVDVYGAGSAEYGLSSSEDFSAARLSVVTNRSYQ